MYYLHMFVSCLGNQPAPYRGLSGPPSPKSQKSLENVSRGPGTPKSLKKVSGTVREVSGESPESVWRVFLDCPRDFLETFWGPGAGGPGRHFRDFFGISGPEGPRDLCKGRAGSQFLPKICKPSHVGEGVENRTFPKVVMRGCKRSLRHREQRFPKGPLHLPKPVLHRCKPILHQCKRLFAPWVQKTFSHPLVTTLLGISSFRPPLPGGLVCNPRSVFQLSAG